MRWSRRAGRLPPLAGLPIVVKDNINTADMPTTGGTEALRNARPKANAPSLQKLIDAGAIVIGKTNLHELAFGITSTNAASFAGPVKNPYDVTRIPGGSSGGTAAAIAAGIVAAGPRQRHRRLDPHPGGADRHRRPAAVGRQRRRGAALSRHQCRGADQPHPRHHRPDGPHRRRRGAARCRRSPAPRSRRAASLKGKRIGIPASFWSWPRSGAGGGGESRARQAGSAPASVFVDGDLPGLADLNAKVSFPVALHEPVEDIPAYLAASGIDGRDARATSPARSQART